MKCIFHIHTVYSGDGRITLPELARRARAADVRGLFITDHNTIEGALRFRERFPDFHTVVGEEIMTTAGEVMGLFLENEIAPGKSLEETIEAIREQGGVVVLPHPYDAWRPSSLKPEVHEAAFSQTDAVEIFNGRTFSARHDRRAAQDCERHGKVALYGADAHFPEEIGLCVFEVGEFRDAQSFAAACGTTKASIATRTSIPLRVLLRARQWWGSYSALRVPERLILWLQRLFFKLWGGRFASLSSIDCLCDDIAAKVAESGFKPDVVIGIAGGGLYPAHRISVRLGVSFDSIRISYPQIKIGRIDTDDLIGAIFVRNRVLGNKPLLLQLPVNNCTGKRVLLVDDDLTSGKTLKLAADNLPEGVVEIRTAAVRILGQAESPPDYFGEDRSGSLFRHPRFPWIKYSPEYPKYAMIREKWLYPSQYNASSR